MTRKKKRFAAGCAMIVCLAFLAAFFLDVLSASAVSVNGNTVTPSGSYKNDKWRVEGTVTTTDAAASTTIKVSIKWAPIKNHTFGQVGSYLTGNATIGGTTVVTKKASSRKVNADDGYTIAMGSGSKTITKTHSAQTIKVTGKAVLSSSSAYSGTSSFTYNVTVPAKASYAVSYYANGGSGAPGAQTKWYGESLKLSSVVPKRTGYLFNGWNTNSSGTGVNYAPGTTYTGNAALNLYAKWKKDTGDFSFNGTVSGVEFEKIIADADGNATYTAALGHSNTVLIPGLDQGSGYQIAETDPGSFAPYFIASEGGQLLNQAEGSAEAGQPLTTQKEILRENTAFEFTNEKAEPEGVDLTIKKRLVGNLIKEADRQKSFTFRYMLKGLDPEETFKESPGEKSITPNPDGTYIGSLTLRAGETAVLEGLTPGAQYIIGELGDGISVSSGKAEFASWYEVTDGEETVDSSYRFFSAEELGTIFGENQMAASGRPGASGAYAYETLQAGAPVEYTFTNAKYDYAPLTITKRITQDGEENNSLSDEAFNVTLNLSGLEPGRTYRITGGALNPAGDKMMSTADGKAELCLRLKAGDSFTVQDLPCSARCELTEEACRFLPMLSVKKGSEDVFADTGEFGKSFSTSFTCHDQDANVILTNERPRHANLTISKEFTGRFDEEAEIAHFTAEFTGLDPALEYQVCYLSEEGQVFREEKVKPRADGTGVYEFALKNGQTVRIQDLPVEARYRITEAGQDGITPSYLLLSDDVDIKAKADRAKKGEVLSTGFEKMTIDRSYAFYNDLPDLLKKTVSDGDGLTLNGAGEEIEAEENFVPTLKSSWIYHISDEVKVPVGSYSFHDILPPFVETTVFDPTESEEDAPFRVYWEHEGKRIGGAVTEENPETGEYYVKSGDETLFTILYDPYGTNEQGEIHIEMNDEETMLLGDGKFDVYFKAALRDEVTRQNLISAEGCYDGVHFTFVNDATTVAGGYTSQSNEVTTRIPEAGGLTVKKAVRAAEGLKETGKKFRFGADFSMLSPGKTYSYEIPKVITARFVMRDGAVVLETSDAAGGTCRDVTARIYNDEERSVARLGTGGWTSLAAGDYRAVISRGETSVTVFFTIEHTEGGKAFSSPPQAVLYGTGELYRFTADDSGCAEVVFEIADGESAVFVELPDQTVYEITELAAEKYSAAYVAVTGASYVKKPQADTDRRTGRTLSTGKNTLLRGADVTFQYTNSPQNNKIKIRKIGADGAPVDGARFGLYRGAYRLEIPGGMTVFEDLPEEGLLYKDLMTNSSGYFKDDLSQGVRDAQLDLPPGEYTLFETEVPEGSSYQIASPVQFRMNDDGTHQVWDPDAGRYGASYDETIGVAMIDEKRESPSDLILSKNVTGDLGDRSKQFEFTVSLEGLEGGRTYDEPADESIPADIIKPFTAAADGTATVQLKLRDGERACLCSIPVGATYVITEAASDHVASYQITADGEEPVIKKDSDTNGNRSAKALPTAEETVHRGDGTVYIAYSNNRDLAPVTGIPSGLPLWIIAGILVIFAQIILYKRIFLLYYNWV